MLSGARVGFIKRKIRGDLFEGGRKSHPGQLWMNLGLMILAGLGMVALACWA